MNQPKSPVQLLSMARDFMASRILISGAELDVFTPLAQAPLSAQELADKTGYFVRPLTTLLDALAALGFLVKTDERYQTDPSLTPFLSSASPTSVLPMILHAGSIWHRWSNLTRIVKETGVVDRTPGGFRDPKELKAFIGAMHVVGAFMADQAVTDIGPGEAKFLLDIGGASGTYTLAFIKASPKLKATLFDKPEVVEMARERIGQAGLLDRVNLVGGDFYKDDLPPGHDLALLSAIIHQNSPEQNLDLYRKVFQALVSGGRVVIRDHVMKPDRTSPLSGALFAINMLVGTPGGKTYTFEEIKDGLARAGFTRIRVLAEGEPMRGLVEAFKP